MLKKILAPLVILGMVFFVQCTDDPIHPDVYNAAKGGNGGGGNGGGGNGNGNGGGNGGNGGSGGLYGDLVICLRADNGIPDYAWVMGEQDELGPAPQPIKIDIITGEPKKNVDYDPTLPYHPDENDWSVTNYPYEVFSYNELGEVEPEEGYIVKEVEFGRLNVVRAPQSVLDAALSEAKNGLTGASEYKFDASGRIVGIFGAEDWLVNYDDDPNNDEFDDKTIDAPRENVAIYQELMSNGWQGPLAFLAGDLSAYGGILNVAFGAIAAGADKTGTMNVDEFGYMNDWLLKWDLIPDENKYLPDEKERMYYNYEDFTYNRWETYKDRFVRELVAIPGEIAYYSYYSLYGAVTFTDPALLPNYSGEEFDPMEDVHGLTAFAIAADDAIQVLEYIHGNSLIEYSPYFDESWNDL